MRGTRPHLSKVGYTLWLVHRSWTLSIGFVYSTCVHIAFPWQAQLVISKDGGFVIAKSPYFAPSTGIAYYIALIRDYIMH